MIEHIFTFRVMYPDTDKMGTMHHSNYAKYYETARWELFRNLGISYKSVEDSGFLLPVVSMNCRFIKTVKYDELLTIKTTLKTLKGPRICFTYKMYNQQNQLVNEADTVLAFVNSKNWKPCIAPHFIVEIINKNIKHEQLYN